LAPSFFSPDSECNAGLRGVGIEIDVWQKKKKRTKFFYNFFFGGLKHDEQKKSHHMILCKITQGIRKKKAQKDKPKNVAKRERERELVSGLI